MICYATLCDFGNPDRTNVITVHQSLDTAQRAFARIARAYGPTSTAKGRCWTVAANFAVHAGDDFRRGMPDFSVLENARVLHDPITGDPLDTNAAARYRHS